MRITNFFALALAMLCTINVFAQKKTWIIEMDGSIDHQDYFANYTPSPQTLDSWTFNVAAGKQFSDHFTIGIAIGTSYEQNLVIQYKQNPMNSTFSLVNVKYSSSTYKLGLWGRYTYWLDKRFYLYSQCSAGYKLNEAHGLYGNYSYYTPIVSNPINPSADLITSGLFVELFPAIGMNVIRGYGVHMNIGGITYSHLATGDSHEPYNNFHLNFGKQFSFGLHKIIGWRKRTAPATDQQHS